VRSKFVKGLGKLKVIINLLAVELVFLILAHPVYKM